MDNPKILIVDDQLLIRKGIVNILSTSNNNYKVYEAASMKNAISKAFEIKPDLILMDLQLGDGTGAEAARIIRDKHAEIAILFLSSYDDQTSVMAALLAGATGYIIKNSDANILNSVVRLTLKGYTIFNQKSLPYLLSASNSQITNLSDDLLTSISSQQKKVLKYVSQGMTNKEIGREMGLSDKTIRNYLTIIFEKLGITKRTEAAVIYTQSKT